MAARTRQSCAEFEEICLLSRNVSWRHFYHQHFSSVTLLSSESHLSDGYHWNAHYVFFPSTCWIRCVRILESLFFFVFSWTSIFDILSWSSTHICIIIIGCNSWWNQIIKSDQTTWRECLIEGSWLPDSRSPLFSIDESPCRIGR